MGIVIGITGKAGSGKDTAADHLVNNHGFIKISWAAPIKAALAAMGFPEPADRNGKEIIIPGFEFSWREAAQTLGTEWGRTLDPAIWVKLLAMRVMKHPELDFVISDVRFDNEAMAIRNMGGKVVQLTGRQADLGDNEDHISERGITIHSVRDTIIDNSGELADTLLQLEQALRLPPQ